MRLEGLSLSRVELSGFSLRRRITCRRTASFLAPRLLATRASLHGYRTEPRRGAR